LKLDLARLTERLASFAGAPDASFGAPAAAVAAIVRETGRAQGGASEILLIRRAELEGDPWSGHMAFPGGRRSPADASLLETAIRETREEIGLELEEHGTLLGQLGDVPAMAKGAATGMIVRPYVFAVRGDPPLPFDAREVAEVLWTPLEPLARGEGAGTYAYEHEGLVYKLPCLRIRSEGSPRAGTAESHGSPRAGTGERVVWGLTLRMLQQLFEALRA
jgi:8-oxo-dGTP pyrophosphatase MutT (NUDIX family)